MTARYILVETRHYVLAWGKEPRGHGLWAFRIGAQEEPLWVQNTYGKAVTVAKRCARDRGVSLVEVMS